MAKSNADVWLAGDLYVDPLSLPHTIDLSSSRIHGLFLVVFGTVWTGALLGASGEVSNPDRLLTTARLSLIALGIAILFGGIASPMRRKRATLHGDGVAFEHRGLLGSKSWFLPYADYRGVAHRKIVFSRGRDPRRPPVTQQIIELLHGDPQNSIPLFISETTETPRAQWERYARQLRVPALEVETVSSSGAIVRHPGDLDTPLRTLLRDGKVDHTFDRTAPVPAGLILDSTVPNSPTITIAAGRTPIWFYGLFLLPGIGMAFSAFMVDWIPALAGGAGLVSITLPIFLCLQDRLSHRQLVLDRDRLILTDPVTTARHWRDTLPLEEIESIAIRRRSSFGDELVILGDNGRMCVGIGLSREALIWLKEFLIDVIVAE